MKKNTKFKIIHNKRLIPKGNINSTDINNCYLENEKSQKIIKKYSLKGF